MYIKIVDLSLLKFGILLNSFLINPSRILGAFIIKNVKFIPSVNEGVIRINMFIEIMSVLFVIFSLNQHKLQKV